MSAFPAGAPAPFLAMAAGRPPVRQLAAFLAVGCVGLASDAALFSLLHGCGLSRAAARALSLACATGVTWRLNRAFTFPASGRRQRAELGRYAAVALGAQGTSYAIFLALSWAAPGLPALLALLAGAVLATALSFAGQRLMTFRAHLAAPP